MKKMNKNNNNVKKSFTLLISTEDADN